MKRDARHKESSVGGCHLHARAMDVDRTAIWYVDILGCIHLLKRNTHSRGKRTAPEWIPTVAWSLRKKTIK